MKRSARRLSTESSLLTALAALSLAGLGCSDSPDDSAAGATKPGEPSGAAGMMGAAGGSGTSAGGVLNSGGSGTSAGGVLNSGGGSPNSSGAPSGGSAPNGGASANGGNSPRGGATTSGGAATGGSGNADFVPELEPDTVRPPDTSKDVSTESELLAFPTAEGYGKNATGGRGGEVYEVTNLDDSGAGSFRDAVSKSNRTVVFRTGGTINLASRVNVSGNVTIAGQTAPGDGITLAGNALNIGGSDVIVRFIRVRFGDTSGGESDTVGSKGNSDVILDHVSASWSVDETVSLYFNNNVTIQWSMITESLYDSNHKKGPHGFGGIWGNDKSTYHHNLLAHHSSRAPRWASGAGANDYRNNVVYNWGFNSCYGGEQLEVGKEAQFNAFSVNMVANYYKPGPGTEPGSIRYRIANPSSRGLDDYGDWYVAGNVMEGSAAVTADNWLGVSSAAPKKDAPWAAMPIKEETAEAAYLSVLNNAGASIPERDPIDARVIDEVRLGTATYGGSFGKGSGIIDSQKDVGGLPALNAGTAPPDGDHDGMPDAWETLKGLNPDDPADRNKTAPDGYTMLEKYLNSLVFTKTNIKVNNLKKLPDSPIQTNDGVWQDPPAPEKMDLQAAQAYCENLTEGGSDAWYLPSIDQLRTIVSGCSSAEPNGACDARNSCVEVPCITRASDCGGCGSTQWAGGLSGAADWYWSSTQIDDRTNQKYGVNFGTGEIEGLSTRSGTALVRCLH